MVALGRSASDEQPKEGELLKKVEMQQDPHLKRTHSVNPQDIVLP